MSLLLWFTGAAVAADHVASRPLPAHVLLAWRLRWDAQCARQGRPEGMALVGHVPPSAGHQPFHQVMVAM